ncbi:MAG: hypothetical protein M1829_001704 [Trizodia sp. TS-e1964]|nr:MAG: hypothetical protein M1829_001704 [Trizodia sp. TS-e1964]
MQSTKLGSFSPIRAHSRAVRGYKPALSHINNLKSRTEMGNFCGKESSSSSPFSTPGRTLSSAPGAPASNPRAGIPPHSRAAAKSTLGASSGAGSSSVPTDAHSARTAAADAAKAREQKAAGAARGKLSRELEGQRRMTRRETLEVEAEQARRVREVDEARAVVAFE